MSFVLRSTIGMDTIAGTADGDGVDVGVTEAV
jgi:hypothetical protein